MTVQTKIHDGMLLHLNALTMEVKEILTLIYDTPQIQQVANTYTAQFWGKNPIAWLKPNQVCKNLQTQSDTYTD